MTSTNKSQETKATQTQPIITDDFDKPVIGKNEAVVNPTPEHVDDKPKTEEEVREEVKSNINIYTLAGGLIGAGIGAARTKSVAGFCTGVGASAAASWMTAKGEAEPLKDAAKGLLAGFASSALVSEALAYTNIGSDSSHDSDEVIKTVTETVTESEE